MCGIVGVWGPMVNKQAELERGCRSMRERGPDSEGYWQDAESGLALGHVRLAILDLSEAGHQPMLSHCGRYVLVLNGEIYNHLDLRAELEGRGQAPDWRGHSDTETMLACLAAWGVEETLYRATGMFAMGLWDRQEHTLSLMRDRMGEKPLYMGFAGQNFVFGSQLKALTAMPGFSREIDRRALSLLVRHNYIPAPWSIYRSMRKLAPGTWVCLTREQCKRREIPPVRTYWSAQTVAQQAREQELDFESEDRAVDALECVLGASVQRQMLADVGLGAFLSGGIDSSVIVALMRRHGSQAVNTYSIGFEEPGYNEAEHAKAVAAHLGTSHTELYVSAADALATVPQLASVYDEPFADSSQIPTLLVSRMARRHVTVALSGDGGDELFGGYSRYFRAQRWWHRRESLPAVLRRPLSELGRLGAALLPAGQWRDQALKAGALAGAPHAGQFYRQFVSYWKDPRQVVRDAYVPATAFDLQMSEGNFFEYMMLLDAITYLPDDILAKVDRAAMSVSLETRVPMIDHHVFEFAQRLPLRYKIRDGRGKWLLRQLLYRHVPAALVDRPKKGFSVPLAAWLRGPLKDWGASLLDPSRLLREGLFEPQAVQRKWREHQSGARNWSQHLWSILMMQAWLDSTIGTAARAR